MNDVFPEVLSHPPKEALKEIKSGRLKGKSDINPQWRYEAMTSYFGPIGTGWYYTIDSLWREDGADGVVFAFAMITLYVTEGDKMSWSMPIQGIGGSQLIQKEREGLHSNDEGYKMAVTDALSTAMQKLGVAHAVYAGMWDGSKYRDQHTGNTKQNTQQNKEGKQSTAKTITNADGERIKRAREECGLSHDAVKAIMQEAPMSCKHPPNDLQSKHVEKVIERIYQERDKNLNLPNQQEG